MVAVELEFGRCSISEKCVPGFQGEVRAGAPTPKNVSLFSRAKYGLVSNVAKACRAGRIPFSMRTTQKYLKKIGRVIEKIYLKCNCVFKMVAVELEFGRCSNPEKCVPGFQGEVRAGE
ncbi:hypothetical protein TNCT_576231 [Trichonephila clavata]|uniref:Uncharacterized protein n=1 Tax=Trichonephila clavata TaxID=2740835 RepID=A0A8X6JR76_TRICU|nr:hypothetical protein TNCT_576231 [Trichonephila clavata]